MRLAAGMVGALTLLAIAVPATADSGARIRWETETPSILFRHVSESVYFGDSAETPRTLLYASLSGRLLSLAPADTALYAVFVDDREQLHRIGELLNELGTHREWPAAPHYPLSLGGNGASYERIPIDRNGRLVIHADEARHPAAHYLAVVNSVGEVLGSRPVWAAPEESGAMALNETSEPR